ncbi:MAG: hypothetical protein R3305_09240, partial [Gammaproteobacteria bacterium]|nr:hypothetical protein [Gammaproteobacteria bacterium]
TAAIAVGANVVQAGLAQLPGMLSFAASLIVGIWMLLAIFALIGSALRAHRLDFEIVGEVVPAADRALRQRHDDWRKTLDIAYASIRSGMVTAGYKTLHDLVDDNGDSLEINHWLVENMLDWEDKKYGLQVAAKLMPRLLALDDGAGALDLYRRCRRYDTEFTLPAAEAERLAAHAAAYGQTGLANELSYNRRSD